MSVDEGRQGWLDLLEALALMAKHPHPGSKPLYCSHDKLGVCADETAFSADEIAVLEKLGFSIDSEGGFYSFRFANP